LLPFVETRPWRGETEYSAGRDAGVFPVGAHRIGVLICLEAIYPALARDTVRAGADALFNLSNDAWYGNTAGVMQHFQKVVFRAIENRVPVVRATGTGVSALIDPSGEVRARLPEHEAGVLHASLPRAWRPSFYRRFGDVFALGCCAAVTAALGIALARVSRDRGESRGADPVRAPR
jgi:apolipoprotein N-acyltransferase